ncbi:MAG: N-6 DNA methylase, partial [Candidatus Hydrogenedentes bacterium]|nr:N-6 DNA methylase [Candidatus Hydrogenedentota bacterium]
RPEDYGLPAGERLNELITQSWNRLRKHWSEFRSASESLPVGEAATGLTNDKWNLPILRELGFGFLPTSAGPELGGRTYAINRFSGSVPIHLIGCGLSLDRRAAGVRGAAAANPHGLVQEFLNRSPGHLWAILSNGLRLRILRDNQALSRQSFLEFDLEAIFAGELYSDFVLLWLVAHATRFAPREGDRAESCWLERWTKIAEEEGTRALTNLRGGVEKALEILGQGLVSHPKNAALREALRKGEVELADFHEHLLRVVYRLIFLFVAEDREIDGTSVLHPPENSDDARLARERYTTHYSTRRLRDLASRVKGSRHGDLWQQFQLLIGALSGDERFATMREALALPALGSMLWNPISTTILNGPGLGQPGAELTNHDFLEAIRLLAFTRHDKVLRPVDYKNLGSEEFGGVYESFLALTPQISGDGTRFTFAEFAGNERKTSGSYYTPDSLVQCLLDSALDPVVQERLAGKTGMEAEKALLAIKVCDKAVGSGHFLVGAAHRLARHLSRVRAVAVGESEPSPLLYQTALRDVIGHCLYGVDINPMAVELCKVTLWLEALEPGKPLSFLDHHIRCGNSLVGATPDLISAGLPDEAFEPIEGDDKEACSRLKKLNRAQRAGFGPLFSAEDSAIREKLHKAAAAIDEMSDSRPEDIQRKEAAFRDAQKNNEFQRAWDLASLWCAAFVIKKYFPGEVNGPASLEPATLIVQPSTVDVGLFGRTEEAPKAKTKKPKTPSRAVSEIPLGITTQHLRDFVEGGALPDGLIAEAKRLADQYQFFHFHLAFPEVFAQGGFDVSLGNPPWDKVELMEKEWFSDKRSDIANAQTGAKRKKLIENLKTEDPLLFASYLDASRSSEGDRHFIQHSGRYPLCGSGRINTYATFAETARLFQNPAGRIGYVLPSGIGTDDTTKLFFQKVVETETLFSFFDFENKLQLFPGVAPVLRFCLVTLNGTDRPNKAGAHFIFFAQRVEDLLEPDRKYSLTSAEIRLINPNSQTAPIFRTRMEAEIAKRIYAAHPVLIAHTPQANPWKIMLKQGLLNMTSDSEQFVSKAELEALGYVLVGNRFVKRDDEFEPLWEAKLVHQFDHRRGSFAGLSGDNIFNTKAATINPTEEEKGNPHYTTIPRYWVNKKSVEALVPTTWCNRWFIAFRDIIQAMTNARCAVFTVIPRCAVSNKLPLVFPQAQDFRAIPSLLATLNSFVFDFCTRQKIGGTSLNFYILEQLPVISPLVFQMPCDWSRQGGLLRDWLLSRVIELTYTAWDLEAFAQDCGWSGPPFRWDEERRFLLRCELDAAFFHLYLGSETEWHQQPAALTQAFPTPRAAVSYIMDTFPIVKRKDEGRTEEKNTAGEVVKPGRYITKDTILEIYDAMAEAIQSGKPYQTTLNPTPADPSCRHPKKKIGILAFGSLIGDPGPELAPKIIMRIKTPTPFPVEYGRYSQTRSGAPTLVPHPAGAAASGEILVLDDAIPIDEARDMLWRRERRKEGTGEAYVAGTSPNSVLVCEITDSPCVSTVLYIDFPPEGKINKPNPDELARKAIQSVKAAKDGKDGITYLLNNIAAGIKTPLTADYEAEILKQTQTRSLQEALEYAKEL